MIECIGEAVALMRRGYVGGAGEPVAAPARGALSKLASAAMQSLSGSNSPAFASLICDRSIVELAVAQ
jgi:hypothetical protein